MIAGPLKILILTTIGLVLSWGWTLYAPPAPESLDHEADVLLHLIEARPRVLALFQDGMDAISFAESGLSGAQSLGLAGRLAPALAVAAIRMSLSLSHLPHLFLLLAVGLTIAFALRERIRHGLTYASPARAYLAKNLAVASILAITLWSATPLPIPYPFLWLFHLTLTMGATAYVANLPIKL